MIARIRRRLVRLVRRLSAFARGGLRYSGRRRYLESALRVVVLVALGIAVGFGGYIAFGLLLEVLAYLVRMVVVLVLLAIFIAVFGAFLAFGGAATSSAISSAAPKPSPKSRDILDRYQRPVAGPPPGSDAPKKPRR
jgi:hypothetical protein